MDKTDLIYELAKTIDQKQDLQNDKLDCLTLDVARNTADIKYHIKRTNLLEELVKENAKEIIRVEAPQIFLRTLFKLIIGLGSFFAAIYTIYRFF